MRTRLINLHTSDEAGYVFIGRPSKWGNPFIKGRDGDRDEVCRKYDQYFNERIRIDKSFREEIKSLKGKVLACYCKPAKCHGDTIIKYLNENEQVESGQIIE